VLRTPHIAQAIRILILNYLANKSRAVFLQPGYRIVNVFHGKHSSQIAKRIHGRAAMISNYRWRQKP
jgi:hypothetical protein